MNKVEEKRVFEKLEKALEYVIYNTDSPLPDSVIVAMQSLIGRTVIVSADQIKAVFECWNQQGVVKHRHLTGRLKGKIKSALRDMPVNEVEAAIRKYGRVMSSEQYWWNHKWTLEDFLVRGLLRFSDMPLDYFEVKTEEKVQKKKDNIIYNSKPSWKD